MKKHPRLSAIFVAVSAASLVLMSSAGFAMGKQNYKGEANYKAEVPPPCPPVRVLLDGFYVGAGVSYDSYRFNHSFHWDDPDSDDFSNFSNQIAARGWDGEINLGYGRYWDAFYLAGEVHGVWSGADADHSASSNINGISWSSNYHAKARGSWALSLLPGLKVNDSTLVYLRAGYIRTNFKVSGNFTETDFFDTDSGSWSRSRWEGGFIGGVGIETWIADNVSLRGEYQYSAYSNIGTSHFVNGSGHVRPSNSSYTLGLQYHFA